MEETLWVLSIDHEYGTDAFVHRTEEGARNRLARYADEWWDREIDPVVAKPVDRDERIGVYFDIVEREYYSIAESKVYD